MLIPTFFMIQVSGRVVPSSSSSTLTILTLLLTLLMITLGSLEWVRSRIMVRVSNRLDSLLGRDVYCASFKKALSSGGMDASAQPLNNLTSVRQFLTGQGLFAFFDAPWLPIYTAVMFLFHPWYGWMTVAAATILVALAYLNHRYTASALTEADKQSVTANLQTTKSLRNAEVIESMEMLDTPMARWAVRQRRGPVTKVDHYLHVKDV